jgi:hypothetical protein
VSTVLRNHTAASQAQAVSQWNTAASAINAEMATWQTSIAACNKSQSLSCARAADGKAATDMNAFAKQVQGIVMPTAATSAAAAKVVTDAGQATADLTTVSLDDTVAQYQADIASSGLSPDLSQVQTDMNNVASAFNAPFNTPITS